MIGCDILLGISMDNKCGKLSGWLLDEYFQHLHFEVHPSGSYVICTHTYWSYYFGYFLFLLSAACMCNVMAGKV